MAGRTAPAAPPPVRKEAAGRAPRIFRRALPALAAAWLLLGAMDCSPREKAAAAEPGQAGKANRLIHESSPYLLLHAHNPVDWYPWGEEAFATARREQKPIFLSVGYSSCYWCHVMEREVFSNPAIAASMNRWFVNVKVDREERPDVDEVYITAAELATGGAGWPNSVFLTPELEPFYAGTYMPPDDRDGRPGFPTVLKELHESWARRRSAVRSSAARLAAAVRATLAARQPPAGALPGAEAARQVVAAVARQYRPDSGGFGGPPMFPSPGNLFLLWEQAEGGDAGARQMVLVTLHKMGEGAIYDQVGGGFHRYTLDSRWRVPHFEKMLYDNAQLAEVMALAWRDTHDPELERLTRGTLDFVLAGMTASQGGFESAIDAETGGVEGAYYTWSLEDLRQALGEDGFRFLAPVFGFGTPESGRGATTLYLALPLADQARRLGLSRAELLRQLEPCLDKLRAARRARRPPRVDGTVLTDWNGLMIAALARAGAVLGEPRYVHAAERAAGFVLASSQSPAIGLLHAWRAGEARVGAFLDDYADFIHGLLALAEATADPRWLAAAERLAGEMERRLAAPQGGYFSSAADPSLLVRTRPAVDGARPAGNAVAILDLLALARLTGKPAYRERAESALRAFAPDLENEPAGVPTLALAVLRAQPAPAPQNPKKAKEGSHERT
jgi:uncharacterized protein YyaL (SSP411 family)